MKFLVCNFFFRQFELDPFSSGRWIQAIPGNPKEMKWLYAEKDRLSVVNQTTGTIIQSA
jgi:hypothetical protein